MVPEGAPGPIVVIGDVMVDRYITGSVSRISPEAPVPVLVHGDERIVPGGAANVAANAAALGARVTLVGLVGRDREADLLNAALAAHPGIVLDLLVRDPGRPTITKTRVMSGRQQIVRIDAETVAPPGPQMLEALIGAVAEAVRGARVVVLSDYAKGVLSDNVIAAAIAAAQAAGVPVVVDPKRRTFEAYRGASLVTPNRSELAAATGLPDTTDAEAARAAEAASAQFGGDVLVTRAEKGMTLWRRGGRVLHVPAKAREVFDVSGAGDTALAALAVALSAGQPLEACVHLANAAAAVAVGKLGTAVVTRAELLAALEEAGTPGIPPGALLETDEAARVFAEWRAAGARVVFTNGCFDLMHPGHVALLEAAAREGDRLVVALNTDASVKRLKGEGRPVQDEAARARVMGALRCVDLVVLFDEDTPLRLIETLKPDVLVKGADYREDQVVGADVVKAYGGRVALVPLVAGRSTSALVAKAKG
ncbi:D-glycero-beta-D-manno-heptose-7-phosphate kinase [Xanthobacter tagetidis]|uniref:Bifunctional protein HldE n=1 Tax=Xanthobacter tagetidis TaxID=60216 RepID=A0A3L7A0B8_9HYPH|nr:D-glycero-beta-D-manno-heptose-7-phosphate kinase [Xanthobacter tagetidis]MBB6309455.1 D-beta-D-heptose 7-phosphate kinase/D-beta-D-heptose 1-phosphate adenosyltransferase [Xanthobacter tagetidis]RLP73567.1 D-glycero-beta-D-manno-heptose-7-phosphate kinase [Xanthobacter tagetidis]